MFNLTVEMGICYLLDTSFLFLFGDPAGMLCNPKFTLPATAKIEHRLKGIIAWQIRIHRNQTDDIRTETTETGLRLPNKVGARSIEMYRILIMICLLGIWIQVSVESLRLIPGHGKLCDFQQGRFEQREFPCLEVLLKTCDAGDLPPAVEWPTVTSILHHELT